MMPARGKLLGHRDMERRTRYAPLADDSSLRVAERIIDTITNTTLQGHALEL